MTIFTNADTLFDDHFKRFQTAFGSHRKELPIFQFVFQVVKYKLMAMGNIKFIAHLLVSDCHDAEKVIAEHGVEAEMDHTRGLIATPFISPNMTFGVIDELFYIDTVDEATGTRTRRHNKGEDNVESLCEFLTLVAPAMKSKVDAKSLALKREQIAWTKKAKELNLGDDEDESAVVEIIELIEKQRGLNKRKEREELVRLQGLISEKREFLKQKDDEERLNTSANSSGTNSAGSSYSNLNDSAADSSMNLTRMNDDDDEDDDDEGPRIRKVEIHEKIVDIKCEARKCEAVLNQYKEIFIQLGDLKKDLEVPKR